MNGGEIKSNTANTAGGGVFVYNGRSPCPANRLLITTQVEAKSPIMSIWTRIRPSPSIVDWTDGTDIGVTTGSAKVPTENSTVAIATATGYANGYLSYFKSDNDSYEIVPNSQNTQLELKAKPRNEFGQHENND